MADHASNTAHPCRRALLRGAAGAAAMLAAGRADAQIKISQAAAGYQDRPDGDRRCAKCAHFQAPNRCRIIAGPIDPQGSCRLFVASGAQPAATTPGHGPGSPS